jgi:3-oxoacyl-[acyl-carrier protein] reductase
MDLQLRGRVAVITGASRGLGEGIARGLAREGCRLALCARNIDPLNETAASIREEYGVEVLTQAVDITEHGRVEDFIDLAGDHFNSIDILVNNAGGNRRKPFEETTDEDWQAVLELNLLGHLRSTRAAIPHLKASEGGSVLFVSSIFGREAGGKGLSIYNTTKSAVISAAKIMALELASDGIRVNTIAPGSIRFPGGSWDKRVQADPEGMREFVEANIPIGRFGTVEEIADLAAFLSSPRASLITGACINADGGQSHSLI